MQVAAHHILYFSRSIISSESASKIDDLRFVPLRATTVVCSVMACERDVLEFAARAFDVTSSSI